jgi:hypothetical protein
MKKQNHIILFLFLLLISVLSVLAADIKEKKAIDKANLHNLYVSTGVTLPPLTLRYLARRRPDVSRRIGINSDAATLNHTDEETDFLATNYTNFHELLEKDNK